MTGFFMVKQHILREGSAWMGNRNDFLEDPHLMAALGWQMVFARVVSLESVSVPLNVLIILL